MTPRMRIVAGPNGSGKTTLMRRLARDYAVNFYDVINADDIYAEISATGAYAPKMPVEGDALADFASRTEYGEEVKRLFGDGSVSVADGIVRFGAAAVSSYTVALLAEFIQSERFAKSAEAASRDAVAEAFAAGLDITVLRNGRVVRIPPTPNPPIPKSLRTD
jgi:predicted ABC-type ATPase